MRKFSTGLLLALISCTDKSEDRVDPEGTNVGECSDAVDNDRDGDLDCEDSDCGASPDCEQSDTGTAETETPVSDPEPAALAAIARALEGTRWLVAPSRNSATSHTAGERKPGHPARSFLNKI